MLVIVYGFNILGQIANNKFFNERFKYVIPIGFAWFMVTFQLISYPFILLQTSFSMFLLALVPFGILWLGYIVINRKYITWKIKVDAPYVGLVIIIIALILELSSIVYSDSWLYSAMITSTIENNVIYSHNGTLANVQLSIMHHRFESYYLWQAVVAMTYTGNYLVGLITEYKILDAVLIVFSFMELGHQFKFSKLKSSLFALSMYFMLTAQHSFLDLSPFQTTEPPIQLFQISTGTALYHYLIIPFTIIYLAIEKKLNYKQKNIYLLGLLFVYSSVSTTYYYTFPLFIIALLTVKHLFMGEKDNQLVLSFMICWMLIIMSFIGVVTDRLVYTWSFALGFLLLTKAVMVLYNKLSLNLLKKMTVGMMAIYTLAAVVLFNPLVYSNSDFGVDKQSLRLYNLFMNYQNGSFDKVYLPLIFLVFSCVMLVLIFTKKEFRTFGLYIITYCFYFLNPFAITIYKIIGVQPVISRIFAYSFIGYLIVICAFKYSKNILVKVLLIIWAGSAIIQSIGDVSTNFSAKMNQVAQINSNMGGLANYDFDDQSFIVFDNLNASNNSEVYYLGVNKLVVLNPKLSWDPNVKSCGQLYANPDYTTKFKHCYTIYDKDKAEDLNYVYETDKQLVYKNF